VSFTVNVTTPLAFEAPLAAEIVELPVPCERVTAFPLTGLLFVSSSVTVIVEVVEPSAVTEVGFAVTVDLVALTGPGVKVTDAFCVIVRLSVVSLAV
jgi:hypothetical protein